MTDSGKAGALGTDQRSGLERGLAVVTEVRAGEGPTALLLTLNVFLLLSAYYVIKPVREGLILAMPSGAEYKSYLGAAITVALAFIVPIYGRAADRFAKDKLVVNVTLFFASHLVVFYGLSRLGLKESLGLPFFVWVGVFNMMLVAQFWSFANDLYTQEQGKRLFALVGIGASAGGVVGAWVTKLLVEPLGTYQLMLVAAGILCLSAQLTRMTASREKTRQASLVDPGAKNTRPASGAADSESGTFALVFRHKYLLLIAVFSVIFTWVNTNGEYILGTMVSTAAKEATAAAHAAATGAFDAKAFERKYTTGFYGEFFLFVNVGVVVLQTFVVSRLVKFGGLRVAFFVLPFIALIDACTFAAVPMLAILRFGKAAENATDYSVNNTVRNMLWLPTSTEMKYKAKQAIDTFFVRTGDVASAALVWVGASQLNWGVRNFAIVNIALIGGWLFVARGIVVENARMTQARP